MVGSGKTTLARRLYHDRANEYHFDVCAWVTVSNNFQKKTILLELLGCIKVLTDEMYAENFDLGTELYQCLSERRYLIVMDDVWGTEVWDYMKRSFPDCGYKSRILLTTRLSHVADYVNSELSEHLHKRLLNDTESWDMMRRIVFRHRSYFLNLEEVGKKIARSCKGLPLSIVVISGLLSKVPNEKERWEYVAKEIHSNLSASEQCSELVSLSYDHLPHHLKACLLYTGVFPEDFEISASKLVKFWIGEGFLKTSGFESLEEVGEKYLTDLISRQLILISRRSSGKLKTCSVHDLIREFCLTKAKEENFFHSTHGSSESIKDPRRISCPSNFLGEDVPTETSFVRSLISVSTRHVPGANAALRHCKLLRVFDMDKVCLKHFPREILKLVCLRHVYFWCQEEEIHIPKSIKQSLQNLQTLVILQSSNDNTTNNGPRGVYLPVDLWSMPKLRYLKFRKCYLSCSFWNKSILDNLHTLSKLSSSSCNVNFFKRTPNLKKLGVHVEKSDSAPFCLGNVGNLPQLEKLKIIVEKGSDVSIPMNFTLPQNLKKLTLYGTKLPWKDMTMVGSLPNLEELQLTKNAFQGPEWEPIENEFRLLKSLTLDELDLEYWTAGATHFPNLQHLIIWECGKLKEISPEIGQLDTLEKIELDDASPHAVTWATDIENYHLDQGTEDFQVYIYHIWSNEYEQRKKGIEDFERRREEDRRRREEAKRKEEQRRLLSGYPGPPLDHTRFDHHTSFDPFDHHRQFDHGRFPGEGIHRSFDHFTGPGNIRGTPPSNFGGNRF